VNADPRIFLEPPARPTTLPAAPRTEAAPEVALVIDGTDVTVPDGTTILEACRGRGIEVPTLCALSTLTPVNVCRLCVVEVAGSRTLVPACSRPVEAGMVVSTETDRVRHSRRLILELLASAVDLSLAGSVAPDGSLGRWMDAYGVDRERFGPPQAPAGDTSTRLPGHHHPVDGAVGAETVAQPVKVDNDLYVRDYSRCILCYRCVEACGTDAQNTFAIAVAGRGFDAHISTEWDVPLPASACVYCGNCIGVCPTGALMSRSEHEMRRAGTWDEERQHVTETVCPYCGVGCVLELHVQDDEIVNVTSPLASSVTGGHLCIKGRFGYAFVQGRPEG
jgi:NADP-reducing hydrogenase subunit HndD